MSLTPTALSLRHLRKEGWLVEVTERWVPGANIRKDLFGFGDLLAIRGADILIVQTTTTGNMSARIRKIADHENVGKVREANIAIHVHGWSKRDGKYVLREVDVS